MTIADRHSPWFPLPVGAALSLAFAPFDWWPLALLCPAYLFWAWHGASPKRAALLGFLFSSGTYLAGTYWLYHSVYVIGKAPLPLAIFLMLALVAIMGTYMAIVGYCQARWLPQSGYVRYLLALPAAWVVLEWLRGWLFSGFPWLAIGYASMDAIREAYAPIVGVYGIGLLSAVVAGASAGLAHYGSTPLTAAGDRRFSALTRWIPANPWASVCAATFAMPLLLAIALGKVQWTHPVGNEISVAIVQGAVPQEMKWSRDQHDATLKLYRELTTPHWGTQLIVWPESALPDWADSLSDYLSNIWNEARVHRTDMLIGQIHIDDKDGKPYNGVLALSDSVQWYNKHHLVPFGEYFPVPSFVRRWMRLMSLPHSDFSAGLADQPPLSVAGQKVSASICYEDAYATAQLHALQNATLLVNVTNDAWFGDSTARHQHLQISRMRAVEAGRPLLRAANDGISAIIDGRGAIVSQLPSFKADVLTGVVQPRTGLTPYARFGNWPVVSVCLLMLAVSLWRQRMSINGGVARD